MLLKNSKEEIEQFLAEEKLKIEEADRLSGELDNYFILDPRYWKIKNRLDETVKSFRISKELCNMCHL